MKWRQNVSRKTEGRRLLGTFRGGWWKRIKVYLKERGYQGVDWIHMTQDKDRWRIPVNTEIRHSSPIKLGQFLELIARLRASEEQCSTKLVYKEFVWWMQAYDELCIMYFMDSERKRLPILSFTLCFWPEPFSFDGLNPTSFLFKLPYTLPGQVLSLGVYWNSSRKHRWPNL
jgi:hypothetical protein